MKARTPSSKSSSGTRRHSGWTTPGRASRSNKLEGGALTLKTDLAFRLGGFLAGTGTFGLEDEVVTFAANARASVKGLAEVSLDLERRPDGVIAGRAEIPVNPAHLKNFSGLVVVTFAGGVVDAVGTVHYATEKLSGDVTLLVTDAETAKTVAYQHLPPEAINASAKEAAGKSGGAAVPAAAGPKPGPRALAGWGTLTARFNDWLTGSALVIVDGAGHVTVVGKITPQARVEFPQTRVDSRLRIFSLDIHAAYGVPYVGDIFVFFSLSLDAVAKVTPLTLSRIEVVGTYSTDPKIFNNFSLSANLNVSALAALELDAKAGAGLEILHHEIKIGAGVTATAGVKAYLDATPIIGYRELADPELGKRGEFYIHGDMELAAQAFLALAGYLFVALETPWWSPVSDHTWRWPLGELEYQLPGELGFGAEVDYIFGSGKPPAISRKNVDFNSDRFAGDLMDDKVPKGGRGPQEKKGAWKEKQTAPPAPPPSPPKVLDSKGKRSRKDNTAVRNDGKAFADGVNAIDALRKRADATQLTPPELAAQLDAIRRRYGFTNLQAKPLGTAWEITASRGKLTLPKPVRIKVAPHAPGVPAGEVGTALRAGAPTAPPRPDPGGPSARVDREEPFDVEAPSGTEHHRLIMHPGPGGRAQLLVASRPVPLSQVLDYYAGRLDRLPHSGANPPVPRPHGWRENDQPRMQAEASITRLRRVPDREVRVDQPFVPGARDDLARLLHMFAVYDRPAQEGIEGAPAGGQQMSVRVVLRGGPGISPQGMAEVAPRTLVGPVRQEYALMTPDPRLAATPSSRGVVYVDPASPDEILARTWATGGTPQHATNTSHTEEQFRRWFDAQVAAQGPAFLARISAIELRSGFSACSACTDLLTGMLSKVRDAQPPAGRVLAAFYWDRLYTVPRRTPSSIQSTYRHHIKQLRDAGWVLYGPMPAE